MKLKLLTSLPLVALWILSGCSRLEIEDQTPQEDFSSGVIGIMPAINVTKSSATVVDKALCFSWTEGDKVGVVPADGKTWQTNYSVTDISETDAAKARFSGGAWAVKAEELYKAYFPLASGNLKSSDAVELAYTGQTLSADDVAVLAPFAYLYAEAQAPKDGEVAFNFAHRSSFVKLSIPVEETGTLSSVMVYSPTVAWFATKADLSLENGSVSPKELSKIVTLTGTTDIIQAGNINFWMAVCPTNELAGKNVEVTLGYGNGNTANFSTTAPEFQEGAACKLTFSESRPDVFLPTFRIGIPEQQGSLNFCLCRNFSVRTEYEDFSAVTAAFPATESQVDIPAVFPGTSHYTRLYVGTSDGLFKVPAQQKKFEISDKYDYAAMGAVTDKLDIASGIVPVTVNAVTSAMRVHLVDTRHYAREEEVRSICFTSNDTPISGDININFETGAVTTANTSNMVSTVWSNEDPLVKLRVKGPDQAQCAGIVTFPAQSVTGKFTVVTDRATYEFTTEAAFNLTAGIITDITLDFSAPDVQPIRRVGILGDDISSYQGWTPAEFQCYYPTTEARYPGNSHNDVTAPDNTWWHQVIYKHMTRGTIDVLNSFSGTKVTSEYGVTGFIDRCLLFEDPDIIIIHGGTNDNIYCAGLESDDARVAYYGTFDYDTPMGQLNPNKFRSAYIKIIKMLRNRYPGAEILILVGDGTVSGQHQDIGESIINIANHFEIPCYSFIGQDASIEKHGDFQPAAEGHAYIATTFYNALKDYLP